jgi:hypothetical protein
MLAAALLGLVELGKMSLRSGVLVLSSDSGGSNAACSMLVSIWLLWLSMMLVNGRVLDSLPIPAEEKTVTVHTFYKTFANAPEGGNISYDMIPHLGYTSSPVV